MKECTLAKTIARLYETTSGNIHYNSKDLTSLNSKELKSIRKEIQYVFQDPYESLNPRHTIQAILEEQIEAKEMKIGLSGATWGLSSFLDKI